MAVRSLLDEDGRNGRRAASRWLLGRSWCSKLLAAWVSALLATGWTVGRYRPEAFGTGSGEQNGRTGQKADPRDKRSVRPPVARRDADRVFYAGVAPEGWDTSVPRQAETSQEPMMDPPVAVPDPYGWLRDEERTDTEVLSHIEAENNYTNFMTNHLGGLRKQIYDEMLSYIDETDASLPRPDRGYYYYRRVVEGKPYALHCRAPVDKNPRLRAHLEAWDGLPNSPLLKDERIYLDENEVCQEKKYCGISSLSISPSDNLLAYTADFTGNEVYHLVVQDLRTDTTLFRDESMEIGRSVEWGADDDTIFYLGIDDANRPNRLFRKTVSKSIESWVNGNDNGSHPHRPFRELDTALQDIEHDNNNNNNSKEDNTDDELIFEEDDVLFWTGQWKTLDDKYLMVSVGSSETSEVHYLDLTAQDAKLTCIAPRQSGVLYSAAHRNGRWWILSNKNSTPNMQLFTTPLLTPQADGPSVDAPAGMAQWELVTLSDSNEPLIDGSTKISIDGLETFADHVVLEGREGGIPRIWVLDVDDDTTVTKFTRLEFEEPAHDAELSTNWEYDVDDIVITYESLVTPYQHIKVSLSEPNSERKVLKQKAIEGYEQSDYGNDRRTVMSRDGHTEIPISMVYRKDVMEKAEKRREPVHFHMYAYGTYGTSIEDNFSANRLPLLDRGIVYVIVHVRGGGEMGRQWYEEPDGGKYLCKKNTFNDFIDVARWLVNDKKWTTPELLSCEGRSAGGMTIGASINQAPELFKMAILGVPFVDLIATMVDASIPLTAGEWEEWGNPNEKKFFDYMMSYSPMNNVRKNAKYPSCLLLGGLYDPRVQYWEPAKMAQTLRYEQGNGSGPVCLKIEMSAGHFSASDRYKYLESKAFNYAFLLDQVGLSSPTP